MLGLTVLVLALALAACGGGGEEEEEEGPGEREATPAATKTVEAEETPEVAETPEAEKPSGGGEASLGGVPVYPGAEKIGEYSGEYSLPLIGEGLETGEYSDVKWAVYETSDSVDDVASFYKDKMPDKGWEEEGWFEMAEVAWGSYTRDGGNQGAWVAITANEKTEIVIGTGAK